MNRRRRFKAKRRRAQVRQRYYGVIRLARRVDAIYASVLWRPDFEVMVRDV